MYILILGGGPDQLPAISAVHSEGYKTAVVDYDQNCLGKQLASVFIHESNRDAPAIIEILKAKKIANLISTVIVIGSDVPQVAVQIADALNIDYWLNSEAAEIGTDKVKMKNFLINSKIPTPAQYQLTSTEQVIELLKVGQMPIIMKPLSAAGSRGVFCLDLQMHNEKEIERLVQKTMEHSHNGIILLEKKINGDQLSVEALVSNDECYICGFALRNYEMNDIFFPQIMENGGIQPFPPLFNRIEEVKNIIFQITSGLKIKSGVVKLDLVIDEDTNFINVIEFALRVSGGNFSADIIPKSLGFDFIRSFIRLILGKSFDVRTVDKFEKIYANRYFFREGTIEQITIPPEIETVDFGMSKKIGSFVKKINTHGDRAGYFITSGDSVEDVLVKINKVYTKTARYRQCS